MADNNGFFTYVLIANNNEQILQMHLLQKKYQYSLFSFTN